MSIRHMRHRKAWNSLLTSVLLYRVMSTTLERIKFLLCTISSKITHPLMSSVCRLKGHDIHPIEIETDSFHITGLVCLRCGKASWKIKYED